MRVRFLTETHAIDHQGWTVGPALHLPSPLPSVGFAFSAADRDGRKVFLVSPPTSAQVFDAALGTVALVSPAPFPYLFDEIGCVTILASKQVAGQGRRLWLVQAHSPAMN
jgi:hypothetical protein